MMLVHLAGVMFGACLMQYGAVTMMLLSMALVGTVMPILCLLPHSAAHLPSRPASNRSSQA